jgi:hypothetical protein
VVTTGPLLGIEPASERAELAVASLDVVPSSAASCAASPSGAGPRGERGKAVEAAAATASGKLQSCEPTTEMAGVSSIGLLSAASMLSDLLSASGDAAVATEIWRGQLSGAELAGERAEVAITSRDIEPSSAASCAASPSSAGLRGERGTAA